MVKKSMKKLFVGLAVLSAANICAEADTLTMSKGFFQPRAFSSNVAREMLMQGTARKQSDGWYGDFGATAAYQRSWSQGVETSADVDLADSVNGLGVFPFWSGTNVMSVGTNDGDSNLDAYQFGLGQVTTLGSITLDPVVYQAGADFQFIVGSSDSEPGFFGKIKSAVGVYNINPQLTEVEATAAATYPVDALNVSDTAVNSPASTMTQAFAGTSAANGDFVPMKYGLIDGEQSTGAKFGDIEMTLGYRFISNDDNSASVGVRASAPTGGSAEGVYALEPIFGRGGNWTLGGYADASVKLWEGNNENYLMMKTMTNVVHLFATDTMRQFDTIANGAGSKYLLVAKYADGVYGNQIQNLVNVSTLACDSSFGVEGDIAVAFTYAARGWAVDLGYEFWGRSSETLEITGTLANDYAILGRQLVDDAECQPTATISSTVDAAVEDATLAANRISGIDALNKEAAQQATSLSSKVFSKVSYEWVDSDYRPHLGLMGELEISNSNNNVLPQWGLSLVGGVSF